MKDEIKNIVLYEKLKEIYNTVMIKRYHESYESINTNIPEDKNIGNINDRWDSFCYTLLDFIEYIDLAR